MKSNAKFDALFTPVRVANVEIRNRIAMAPMSLESIIPFENSYIDNRCKEYLIQRAKGGVGLIILSCWRVENEIEPMYHFQGNELTKAALYSFIELHGHEGYLFDQFSCAAWNKRTDKYGGDLEGRLTFAKEIVHAIKKTAGDDFPVVYRYGLKHFMKGFHSGAVPGEDFKEFGRDIDEGLAMAKILEREGFDALHIDAGSYDSWYWPHPPNYLKHGCMQDLAHQAKQAVGIPVIAVGRMDDPEVAAAVVKDGKADLVAIGRGLLADPEWPNKIKHGQIEEIRPCLGCHDACTGRLFNGKPMCCAVNPTVARELHYSITPATEKKKVLVIGG